MTRPCIQTQYIKIKTLHQSTCNPSMYFHSVVGTGRYTTSTTNMEHKDFTYRGWGGRSLRTPCWILGSGLRSIGTSGVRIDPSHHLRPLLRHHLRHHLRHRCLVATRRQRCSLGPWPRRTWHRSVGRYCQSWHWLLPICEIYARQTPTPIPPPRPNTANSKMNIHVKYT
jgi:hypothetical protein